MSLHAKAIEDDPVAVSHPAIRRTAPMRPVARMSPLAWMSVSAVFHYFGPALAVLLFRHLSVFAVTWLRIGTAAVVLGAWRHPFRMWRRSTHAERATLVALGAVLSAMNTAFYFALTELPLATVGAVELLGPVVLAVPAARSRRNGGALVLAVAGAALLVDVRVSGHAVGFLIAAANCLLFMAYVRIGHRLAAASPTSGQGSAGLDRLAAAMVIACLLTAPLGLAGGIAAIAHPLWLLWGVGVGITSSVIPYVADQLAMSKLSRSSFALILTALPGVALVMGLLVLHQVPSRVELAGLSLVACGLALHRPTSRDEAGTPRNNRTALVGHRAASKQSGG